MSGVVHFGDCRVVLRELISDGVRVQTCVTSPPYYGLRDYGVDGQLGLESSPQEFITNLVDVFALVWEVLADDGTLWLNMGDSYAHVGKWGGSSGGKHVPALHGNTGIGHGKRDYGSYKSKDLMGMPWRIAFALQDFGWFLRQDIIWHKPNPMPESVQDRCTKAHEYLFLLSKSARYYYDAAAIREPATHSSIKRWAQDLENQVGSSRVPGKSNGPMKAVGGDKQRGHSRRHAGFNDRWDHMTKQEQASTGRNKRSVWTVPSESFHGAHFATFPRALIRPCILAGSRSGDTVLDPFFGSGTTGAVCNSLGRNHIGIELNPDYESIQLERTAQQGFEL